MNYMEIRIAMHQIVSGWAKPEVLTVSNAVKGSSECVCVRVHACAYACVCVCTCVHVCVCMCMPKTLLVLS